MKHVFEEPKLCVERFAVTDVLTTSGWGLTGDDLGGNETNIYNPISGEAIVTR